MAQKKTKNLFTIFVLYWLLLAYIIAALIWWFIALNEQNNQMSNIKLHQLIKTDTDYLKNVFQINDTKKRKKTQYIGEGLTFFLIIIAGSVFVYRVAKKQLKTSKLQQDFMMALAHELKTPIAVSMLNLETLQKHKLEEIQKQQIIQATLQETNRLNALCNNMLLSTQMEASGFKLNKEDIEFSKFINDTIQKFKLRFINRHINANITSNIYIYGDRLLLQMAINNIIENAIKYSPKETIIDIDLKQNKNNILLIIKDQGLGIDENEYQHIFKKFYRIENLTTSTAKGTGLGLYLSKNIILQHNGNILVSHNLPKGCIFTITLPTT